MNREDLQTLASLRLREARALYKAKEFSGAYYLAGYAVECGLKACIARKVMRHDFPDRQQKGKDPDPFIRALRKVFRKEKDVAGIRVGGPDLGRPLHRRWLRLQNRIRRPAKGI